MFLEIALPSILGHSPTSGRHWTNISARTSRGSLLIREFPSGCRVGFLALRVSLRRPTFASSTK